MRCTAVQTQSSIVIIHVVKISKVPRELGLDFQCTTSVPFPKKRELMLLVNGVELMGCAKRKEQADESRRPKPER